MFRLILLLLTVFFAGGCASTHGNIPLELSLKPLPELRVLDGSSGQIDEENAISPRVYLPQRAQTEGELMRELARFQQQRKYFVTPDRSWPNGLDAYWVSFLRYVNNSINVLPISLSSLHRLRISLEAEWQYVNNRYGIPALSLVILENDTMAVIKSHIAEIYRKNPAMASRLVFHWPLAKLRISSFYGSRSDPFTGEQRIHRGIDFAAPSGTVIYSSAPGMVTRAGWFRGHGQSVTIKHPGGYSTVYSHMSAIFVALGQTVEDGTTIGLVGSTGRSTGPHLHFEVKRYNENMDPLDIIDVPTNVMIIQPVN